MTTERMININLRGKEYSFHEDYMPDFVADRRAKLVYAINPKCGCTTIRDIMFAVDRGFMYIDPEDIHSSFFSFWQVNNGNLNSGSIKRIGDPQAFMFSAVRHPLNRFVSGFVDKVLSTDDRNYWQARDLISAYLCIDIRGNPLRAAIAYLEWLEKGELPFFRVGEGRDPHFRPQVDNLGVRYGLSLDFIGKMEKFPELVAKIEQAAGRSVPDMVNWKFRKSNHEAKENLLKSEELRDIVRRVYAIDFETFGYT